MRILIATGERTQSDIAIRLGNLVHQMTDGIITLFTVLRSEKNRPKVEANLAEARKLLDTAASQVEILIRAGQPTEEIIKEAAGGQYDLLIIGERAKRPFLQRLQPPIAERLIARVPCPILLARGEPRPFHRVLVCESGHEPSLIDDLTTKMTPLVKKVDRLTLLHIMSQIAAGPGVHGWELRADADELMEEHTPEGLFLEEGVHQVEELDVESEVKVRHGLVVRELLAEAKGGDYDLVVIGAHPGTGWEHFLLGDLAREIIDRIDRPLLVMKR